MMNLDLFWLASRLPGGELAAQRQWRAMAISHARNTARDFFRPDGGPRLLLLGGAEAHVRLAAAQSVAARHQGLPA